MLRVYSLWIVFALVSAGCNSEQTIFPVTGTVKFSDGIPLTSGKIEFETQEVHPAVTAIGTIQPDGSFTLTTYDKHDGALLGKHKIAVIPFDGMSPTGRKVERPELLEKSKLHPKYKRLKTSGLDAIVEPKDNKFDFVVEYSEP